MPNNRGAWWAAVHGVAKNQTRLSDFTFTFLFHALEKAMAPHSSTLAWRVHGVARSRTRLSDFTFTFLFILIYKILKQHTEIVCYIPK